MSEFSFGDVFQRLTDNPPFPWQSRLYAQFIEGTVPSACSIPTGLGKTSVIPIWLIALVSCPERLPRRLVYVVNRRTVVDQSTQVTEEMRARLLDPKGDATLIDLASRLKRLTSFSENEKHPSLAISTLRGQFADNGEWWQDPARPAVVVGTVDMIGSRLLFGGYRSGFRSHPRDAGFLGRDVLIVHDEAHLEPAFQCLLKAIEREQEKTEAPSRPIHILELTATSRAQSEDAPFTLDEKDHEHDVVQQRTHAKKGIAFHEVETVAESIGVRAAEYAESGKAILIFVRTLKDVSTVHEKLKETGAKTALLTGTIRGFERENLAISDPVYQRFLNPSEEESQETMYLICTSAGEVGIDISADHLVCDLTPFESMAQRFGRVNRRGGKHWANLDIFYEQEHDSRKAELGYEIARWKTLDLLQSLPPCDWDDQRRNASPQALNDLPHDAKCEAFSPLPEILCTSDILFDAWTMTSIREDLPGRPPVADYLHGVEENQIPETMVAWREEVSLLVDSELSDEHLAELLSDYPLKPQELLRERSEEVFKRIKSLAKVHAKNPVWILTQTGDLTVRTLEDVIESGKEELYFRTLILSPEMGGLTTEGMLCRDPKPNPEVIHDVADEVPEGAEQTRHRRTTVHSILSDEDRTPPDEMRLERIVRLRPMEEEIEEGEDRPTFRLFFVRPRASNHQGSTTANEEQTLEIHLDRTEAVILQMAKALCLDSNLTEVFRLAARFHDLGKNRRIWQRSIGNCDPQTVLAKSNGKGMIQGLSGYRHELGSLIDVQDREEINALSEEDRELVLHLIATHHGRGRPHFPAAEVFDPESSEELCRQIASEVPCRFARLQRRFGRWGLAWIESLLRAADAYASAHPKEESS